MRIILNVMFLKIVKSHKEMLGNVNFFNFSQNWMKFIPSSFLIGSYVSGRFF